MNIFHVYKKYGNRNRNYFLVQLTFLFRLALLLYNMFFCVWGLNFRFGSKDPFEDLGKLNNPEELDAYIQQTRHEQRFRSYFYHQSHYAVQFSGCSIGWVV
jgi:hypothetical protein